MNTNEPTITVNEDTTLEDIVKQLDAMGLLEKSTPSVYEYRLYYNAEGYIYASASTVNDAESYGLTGEYLVVTREDFENHSKYRVRNGKLVEIKSDSGLATQLEKSDTGFEVAKNNAGILLEQGEEHNNTEHYDYKNR